MRHILLFDEAKTGATIAIGPFTCQESATKWREKHESKLDGVFRGLVPTFATGQALADNALAAEENPSAGRCPTHAVAHGVPFTREQQFSYDLADYCRWAIGPLMTEENFRADWEKRHPACT